MDVVARRAFNVAVLQHDRLDGPARDRRTDRVEFTGGDGGYRRGIVHTDRVHVRQVVLATAYFNWD